MAAKQIEIRNTSNTLLAILTPEDGVKDAWLSRRLNGDCDLSFSLPATSDKLQYLTSENLLFCDSRYFVITDPDSVSHVRQDGELRANIQARSNLVLLDRKHKTICNDDAAKPVNDLDIVITKTGTAAGGYAAGSAGSALAHILGDTGWFVMDGGYWPSGQHEIRTSQESVLSNIKKVQELWGGYIIQGSWGIGMNQQIYLYSESWQPYSGYSIHLAKNLKNVTRAYDFDIVTKLWIFGQNDVDIFDVNVINSGTAQAGGNNTITLAAGAVSVDDAYIDGVVYIIGGTGSGQNKRIVDYAGNTKVATVESNWTTNPDATSTYEIKSRFLLNFGYTSELRSNVWRNQDITDPTELKTKAQDIHAKLAYPRVNYKIEHFDLRTLPSHSHETFTVGDMVDVIDEEMGIAVQVRVIYHKYNVFQPWLCDIELGDESYELKQILGEVKKQSRVNYRLGRAPGTLIIASAGTTKNTRRADMIVPAGSTSAQRVINQAINMLPSSGGKVTLLDGTYIIDGSIILPSNVTLELSGGAIVKLKDSFNADINMITNSDHTYGNTNIRIIGQGTIDGNKANQTSGWQAGICLRRTTVSQVIGLTIKNSRNDGFLLDYDSSNNTITGNTCQGNGRHGINIYESSNNTITGSTCQGNGQHGIYVYYSSNNTITGNTYQGNGYYGIHVSYLSNNNTITGNTCQGNGYYGIYVYYSSNNTITGNTCQGNGQHGIRFYYSSDNTIAGNTCIENSLAATNSYDNIYLADYSNRNNIQNSTCRLAVEVTNKQAQGGGANTITLATDASDVDDYYNNMRIYIRSGTGNGQTKRITDYVGSTKVATVDSSWTTNPDSTSYYDIKKGARYGINIATSNCDGNLVTNNDLLESGVTGNFNNVGTGTIVTAGNRGV